jgi:hypothetical protein
MANVDRPNGFRPSKTLIGAPWTALVREYTAADRSSDTTNNHGDIYIGDPVALSSGLVVPANSGAAVVGVVVAIGPTSANFGETGYYDANNLGKRYLAYNEAGKVGVVPAEGVLFEVQSASDLDLVVGAEADFTLVAGAAHGSRTTGNSNVELTTDSDSDVRVVEVVRTPDNDLTLANARYLVKFENTLNTL